MRKLKGYSPSVSPSVSPSDSPLIHPLIHPGLAWPTINVQHPAVPGPLLLRHVVLEHPSRTQRGLLALAALADIAAEDPEIQPGAAQ